MMLRSFASLILLVLLGVNFVLPSQPMTARGPESRVRRDVETSLAIGQTLPLFELHGLDGRVHTRDELRGRRVLLVFERSVDWCPFTKARLVELRDAFQATPDLEIVWVMSDTQVNARARIFIAELGLSDRILFLADPKSSLIRQLGLLKANPALIEVGVPHPTTLVLDRASTIRFMDVRENFHYWLAPGILEEAVARVE